LSLLVQQLLDPAQRTTQGLLVGPDRRSANTLATSPQVSIQSDWIVLQLEAIFAKRAQRKTEK
jgi:hypothetical protein